MHSASKPEILNRRVNLVDIETFFNEQLLQIFNMYEFSGKLMPLMLH